MAIKTQIKCDVCGREMSAEDMKDRFSSQSRIGWIMADSDLSSCSFFRWSDSDEDRTQHICGAECASQYMSQWISRRPERQQGKAEGLSAMDPTLYAAMKTVGGLG